MRNRPIASVTVTFTYHAGFTDTLFHIGDAAGMDHADIDAFASGVWWGAVHANERIASIDVMVDGAFYMTLARGTSGMPDATYAAFTG